MSTAALVDVVMPQMGVSVSEGTVSRWVKQVGEQVDADETIVEISTDKVDTEVPSPATGTVVEILVPEGETVAVNTRIAVIDTGGGAAPSAPAAPEPEAPPAPPAPPAAEAPPSRADAPAGAEAPARPSSPSRARRTSTSARSSRRRRAAAAERRRRPRPPPTARPRPALFMSPVVARMVAEHGLDIAAIPGTGRGGRVTKKDVEKFMAGGQAAPAAPAAAAPRLRRSGRTGRAAPPRRARRGAAGARRRAAAAAAGRRRGGQPARSIRKVIARNMRHSVETAAQVTSVIEVDMTRVVDLRKQLNPDYRRTTASSSASCRSSCARSSRPSRTGRG